MHTNIYWNIKLFYSDPSTPDTPKQDFWITYSAKTMFYQQHRFLSHNDLAFGFILILWILQNVCKHNIRAPWRWRWNTEICRSVCNIIIQGGAKRTHVFDICLRFLSLGLPQIKCLRSKTSYSRRSESFHSRRNCNCATRNVSKCDAELWGEAPDVCTARRTPYFRYNFP